MTDTNDALIDTAIHALGGHPAVSALLRDLSRRLLVLESRKPAAPEGVARPGADREVALRDEAVRVLRVENKRLTERVIDLNRDIAEVHKALKVSVAAPTSDAVGEIVTLTAARDCLREEVRKIAASWAAERAERDANERTLVEQRDEAIAENLRLKADRDHPDPVEPCNGSCDIALARRQVGPDGVAPGNARECAELWKAEASRLRVSLTGAEGALRANGVTIDRIVDERDRLATEHAALVAERDRLLVLDGANANARSGIFDVMRYGTDRAYALAEVSIDDVTAEARKLRTEVELLRTENAALKEDRGQLRGALMAIGHPLGVYRGSADAGLTWRDYGKRIEAAAKSAKVFRAERDVAEARPVLTAETLAEAMRSAAIALYPGVGFEERERVKWTPEALQVIVSLGGATLAPTGDAAAWMAVTASGRGCTGFTRGAVEQQVEARGYPPGDRETVVYTPLFTAPAPAVREAAPTDEELAKAFHGAARGAGVYALRAWDSIEPEFQAKWAAGIRAVRSLLTPPVPAVPVGGVEKPVACKTVGCSAPVVTAQDGRVLAFCRAHAPQCPSRAHFLGSCSCGERTPHQPAPSVAATPEGAPDRLLLIRGVVASWKVDAHRLSGRVGFHDEQRALERCASEIDAILTARDLSPTPPALSTGAGVVTVASAFVESQRRSGESLHVEWFADGMWWQLRPSIESEWEDWISRYWISDKKRWSITDHAISIHFLYFDARLVPLTQADSDPNLRGPVATQAACSE